MMGKLWTTATRGGVRSAMLIGLVISLTCSLMAAGPNVIVIYTDDQG